MFRKKEDKKNMDLLNIVALLLFITAKHKEKGEVQ